ncbi:MAG: hypothetical protein WC564_04840 [Patescibacteria group bacterium]
MSAAKLNPTEIKQRLKNINDLYEDYIQKIEKIRNQEKDILTKFIKKMEEQKITEIRKSIQQQ